MFRGIFRVFNHSESEREIFLASKAYLCHLHLGAESADDLISKSKLDMQNMSFCVGGETEV
jgi:hypothetical protein